MSAIVPPSLETSDISDVSNDAAIAALVNGLYAYPGYPKIAWDHFEQPKQDEGICWGLKRVGVPGRDPGIDVIVLRGSVTQQDWFRDFDALADPFTTDEERLRDFLRRLGFAIESDAVDHAVLGPVHPGFLAGMEDAWTLMRPWLGGVAGDLSQQRDRKIVVAGHSLGAARAAILSGLMVHSGLPPRACVTFGQPRPGFPQLAKLIADVAQRSYRNGDGIIVDMVTEVPLAIGSEDYVHPHPLTDVCEEPSLSWKQQWGVFAWHAMPLYLRALERRAGLALSGSKDVALTPDGTTPHLEIH